MEHFTVEVEPNAVCDRQGGWEHDAWQFTVTSDSGRKYSSIFRTETGLRDRVAVESELEAMVLESLAMDVTDENLCGSTEPPSVREVIEHLSHDVGFGNPLETYDIAVEMHRLAVWFWSLTPGEQTELCAYADEEED